MISTTLKLAVLVVIAVLTFNWGMRVGEAPYRARHAKSELVSANEVAYTVEVTPPRPETDARRLMSVETPEEVDGLRERLIRELWTAGLPGPDVLPRVEQDITDEYWKGLANLKRIDRLTVTMDYGLESVCYHFIPERANGELAIYHEGHDGSFEVAREMIRKLVRAGFSVVAMSMPLLGPNNRPVVDHERFGRLVLSDHEHMRFLHSEAGHAVRLFIEPVVVVVNHAKRSGFAKIHMAGFSGGGWTTLLASAVDARINRSVSVAGGAPTYLRMDQPRFMGDYEQNVADLLYVANFLDQCLLAATGERGAAREHVQIINLHDPCCFGGLGYRTFEAPLLDRLQRCGRGKISIFVDETHRDHMLSPWAEDQILAIWTREPDAVLDAR